MKSDSSKSVFLRNLEFPYLTTGFDIEGSTPILIEVAPLKNVLDYASLVQFRLTDGLAISDLPPYLRIILRSYRVGCCWGLTMTGDTSTLLIFGKLCF